MKNKFHPYLYDYVKQKVDFPEFLEVNIGCKLQWLERNVYARCACPMPHHKDIAPSFHIKLFENTNSWIFNCFGCNSKGSIIDFFVEYYGLDSSAEAVIYICNKFNLKVTDDFDVSSLKDVKKKVDLQKKMEYIHIVTSNQCRMLLKKDYNRYSKWVAEAYIKMNKALQDEDTYVIESIGFKASNRMQEK